LFLTSNLLLQAPPPEKLGSILPEKNTFTQSQKQHRSATKKVRALLLDPKSEPFLLVSKRVGTDSGADSEQANLSLEGDQLEVFVTFHPSPCSPTDDHALHRMDVQDFIGIMRKYARTVVGKKDDGLLFNPAVFDPQSGEGCRRKEHFVQSSFMVLDFDNGLLTPEAFTELFWDDVGPSRRRSFLLCNSFSRSPEEPNRFRVVLFYKKPANSIEERWAVYDAIATRLADSGYSAEATKLDPQCRSGVQSFWMPCTNKRHQDHARFILRGTKTREILRHGIDPNDYLKTKASASTIPLKPPDRRSTDRREVEGMIAQLQGMSEDRHSLVFDIGLTFQRMGMSLVEIEQELKLAANGDRKLLKKIKGCIRSLKTGKYR
jgi:hypothetical protein